MSRGLGFGVGAGAVTVLAAALAVSPAVFGPVQAKAADKKVKKSDKHVRIVSRGGAAAHLGVRLQEVDRDDVARLKLSEEKGALVTRVEDDSPAAEAGLQADDVIVRYHGDPVQSATQLARLVAETPAGRTVALEVVRGGALQKLTATLGEEKHMAWDFGPHGGDWELAIPPPEPPEPPSAPSTPSAPRAPMAPLPPFPSMKPWSDHRLLDRMVWFGQGPRKLGLEYQEISGQLADYFKVEGDEGVLVTSVEADGPAAKAGLRAGDVLRKVGSRTIEDAEDLRRAVEKAEAGREVAVTVLRDGRPVELKLVPAGPRRERERGDSEL